MTFKRFGIIAAVLVFTLCASAFTAGRQAQRPAREDGPVMLRLTDEMKADGFEAQMKGGKVVGMTMVRQDGSRLPLKQQQGKPVCGSFCPSGQTPSCWEDEAAQMSVCTCSGGGTSGRRRLAILLSNLS